MSAIEPRRRYAVSTWQYTNKSLEAALDGIARAGFEVVELWGDSAHLDPRLHPDVRVVRYLLKKLGLRAHSIHAPFTGLSVEQPEGDSGRTWLAVLGSALRLGADVGAALAVVHAPDTCDDLVSDRLYRSRCDAIRELVGELNLEAQRLGVRLALENLPAYGARCPSRSLQEMGRIITESEVGFCLDIGHAAVNGVVVRDEIRAAGGRLLSIHVSNNDGRKDLHWSPEKGVIDWHAVQKDLAEAGYRQPYVLEVHGGDDPDTVMRHVAQYIQSGATRQQDRNEEAVP